MINRERSMAESRHHDRKVQELEWDNDQLRRANSTLKSEISEIE